MIAMAWMLCPASSSHQCPLIQMKDCQQGELPRMVWLLHGIARTSTWCALQHTQPGCVKAGGAKAPRKGADFSLVACKVSKHPRWLRLRPQQPAPSPEPARGWRVPEVPALHHRVDQAKLMVCWGDKEPLLEKLRCTEAQRENEKLEGWWEVMFIGLSGCQPWLQLHKMFQA